MLRESEIIYNPTEVNRLGNKYNIDFDYTSKENEELDIIFLTHCLTKSFGCDSYRIQVIWRSAEHV